MLSPSTASHSESISWHIYFYGEMMKQYKMIPCQRRSTQMVPRNRIIFGIICIMLGWKGSVNQIDTWKVGEEFHLASCFLSITLFHAWTLRRETRYKEMCLISNRLNWAIQVDWHHNKHPNRCTIWDSDEDFMINSLTSFFCILVRSKRCNAAVPTFYSDWTRPKSESYLTHIWRHRKKMQILLVSEWKTASLRQNSTWTSSFLFNRNNLQC